ncbi:MAG: glycosyltransferase family 2 protein [Lysinibacillus sp.]
MQNVVILIPAYNPLPSLLPFVESLQTLPVEAIIVVNDGSDEKCSPIFERLQESGCIVLQHKNNVGKGKALKKGFQYILKHYKKSQGVITVGAHGQHRIEDVERILQTSHLFTDGIVLAVRQFRSKEVPIVNLFANRAASILFEMFFNKRLLDIQSGLRLLPKHHLFWLKNVPGDGFNFDTNMLVEAIKRDVPIYEVPIGRVRVKKNSVIFYDEILQPSIMIQQVWQSFVKNKFKHD